MIDRIQSRYTKESNCCDNLSCGSNLDYLKIIPGEHILDLGCGRGSETIQAAMKTGPEGKVTGLDITQAMIDTAHLNAEGIGVSNAWFIKGNIESLPFEDDTFDAVMSNCVINHAKSKVKVYNEIFRVLKDGGRFVISDAVTKNPLPTEVNHVANYPGTPGVVRGKEIIQNMREQAKFFGTRIDDLKEISEVKLADKVKYIRTEDTEYFAKAVIIASGARPRALPADGADEFKGRGIHYCATCDGSMYQDRKIVVVGGGNSAVEEAVFLTRFASHVTIIHQFDNFQASKTAQDEAFNNPKIDIIWDSEVRKVNGQGHALTSVVIENLKTKELSEVPTEGAFVYIGTEPMTKMYANQVEIDKWGYIVASEDTKTNVDGVFAAGDIRTKPIRQVVTAASDGAVAGIMAERFVVSMS